MNFLVPFYPQKFSEVFPQYPSEEWTFRNKNHPQNCYIYLKQTNKQIPPVSLVFLKCQTEKRGTYVKFVVLYFIEN